MPPTRIACRDNGKPFFAYLRNRGILPGAKLTFQDFDRLGGAKETRRDEPMGAGA